MIYKLISLISVQSEKTFAHLRYFLGGYRPSQTNHQKLFYLFTIK